MKADLKPEGKEHTSENGFQLSISPKKGIYGLDTVTTQLSRSSYLHRSGLKLRGKKKKQIISCTFYSHDNPL